MAKRITCDDWFGLEGNDPRNKRLKKLLIHEAELIGYPKGRAKKVIVCLKTR